MIVGVVKETERGERRVAIVPGVVPLLAKAKADVVIQSGAGETAGFGDQDYQAKGARILAERSEVFRNADVLCQVRIATRGSSGSDAQFLRPELTLIGLADPLGDPEGLQKLASTGVRCFALELLPRITRAQSMDVL